MRQRVRNTLLAFAVALTAVGVAVPTPVAAAAAGVDPGSVELTLRPGGRSTFAANVTTPPVVPNPDIVFLADVTGSMNPSLANVRNNLPSIMTDVRAAQPNARFGVAEYKEQGDADHVFGVNTNLTDDTAAVVSGAQKWLYDVGGGGSPQTDFINAHYRLATGAVGFRPTSSRVVVWFGDARSNDPSLGHTLPDTIKALQDNGVRVIAVPVTGTSAPGLDERGQATRITTDTAGVLMPSQPAAQISRAILDGLHALSVTVTPKPTCDPRLTLAANPASRTVRSGTAAAFTETVAVRPGTAAGTYTCAVDFQVANQSVGYAQTVTVHVPGTVPALRIGDVSVSEGDSGATPATVTVSLDAPSTQQVTVGWTAVAGTATTPADFAAGSGTVTFAPGDTSEQVTVSVAGDQAVEGDETFTLHLTNPVNATIADADGVVTIVDDDEQGDLPAVRIGDSAVPEGDSGATPGVLTVSLDRASTQPVTVGWATVEGTATAPEDFADGSGTLTFEPGATSKQVTVSVAGDEVVEGDETFTVHLASPTNATIGDADGLVTILDDDDQPGTPPTLRIGDSAGPEGNVGTTPATFTVGMDKPSTTAVTVHWATETGTAGADDVTMASGELVFAPDEVSKQLTVAVIGDLTPEDHESYLVRLTGATGATITDDNGLGAIDDDDSGPPPVQVPQLRIGDVGQAEGNAGTAPATITVVLDQVSALPVTVHWATDDGSATAPDDYVAGAGDLTFEPGVTTRQITVPIVGDRALEPGETFGVQLTNAVNATISDGTGLLAIGNDDENTGDAELTVDDVAVAENTGYAVATMRLSAARAVEVTVRMTTVEGTATDPEDYTGGSALVTFQPGQTLVQAPIALADDTVAEGDETFVVALSEATGAPVADPDGVVTILDDDGGPGDLPTVGVDDTAVAEADGPGVFEVHLTKAGTAPITVRWASTDGTAGAPGDFTASSGQVTFAPGQTTGRIEVPITDDTVVEGDETFTVTLSEPAGARLGDATAVGTILDDDDDVVRPTVSVADTSVREDRGPAGFLVRLSEAATETVTVDWTTGNGTAAAPGDFAGGSGRVVFTAGQTSAQVSVPIVNDTVVEPDETFTLTLSEPDGATLGDGAAVGTIVNDDVAQVGKFNCTSSAADLFGRRPAVANPGGTPCVDDTRTAGRVRLNVGLLAVTADGLTASTDQAPGGMSATAGLLTTRITTIGLNIEIGTMTATATTTCVAGPTGLTPVFAGSSQIASLKVNGVRIPIGSGAVRIPLVLGSLSLNSTVATKDGLTQRAFDLRTLLGNVVVGEAHVGVSGNPCG